MSKFLNVATRILFAGVLLPLNLFGQAEVNPIYRFSSDILRDSFPEILPDSFVDGRFQLQAEQLSFISQHHKALETYDTGRAQAGNVPDEQKQRFLKMKRLNAAKYVTDRAGDSCKVLMINEAHHNSRHRRFTESMLKNLAEQGFKYLGCEAFSRHDNDLDKRGYPLQKTGAYTRDPEFGNLIRTAKQLGFELFSYEAPASAGFKERERQQALNILKVLEKDPEAKIVIHCGFDHLSESPLPEPWGKSMAMWLHELSGIDPLTVDQVLMDEHPDERLMHGFARLKQIDSSTVFEKASGDVLHSSDKDVLLFHPKTKLIHNRPNWLFGKDRVFFPLNMEGVSISFPFLAMAFDEGETQREALHDLVPIDIVEVTAENVKDIGLLLPPGKYLLVLKPMTGQTIKQKLKCEMD